MPNDIIPISLSRQLSLQKAFAESALGSASKEVTKLQEQITSGRRINRPSDDPTALSALERLEEVSRRHTQYERSMDNARAWFDHSQEALQQLTEVVEEARVTAIQASESNMSTQTERDTLADSIQRLMDSAVDVLNTKYGEQHIFAGTQTDTQPFTTGGAGVTYNGNNTRPERRIGQDTKLSVSATGQEVISVGGGRDLFQRLADLRDALSNGNRADINQGIGELKESHDHLLQITTDIGTQANRLENARDRLAESEITLANQKSKLRDTDYIQAMTRLQNLQTSYQAALKVTGSVMQTSLVDYLR